MVFPKKNSGRYLSLTEEEELFSYIFAGILFEKNISSKQLMAGEVGKVNARVIQSYEITSVFRSWEHRPLKRPDGSKINEWLAVPTKDGDLLFIEPLPARALHIRFSCNLGEFSVYAEVSFNGDKYNLDNVLNVPNEWLRDLSKLDVDRVRSVVRKRILKIPRWGQRAMLIESETAHVFELPHVSDRGSFTLEYDALGRFSRPTPVRLEDYLANYPERASDSSRSPNKKFTPNNGA